MKLPGQLAVSSTQSERCNQNVIIKKKKRIV